MKSRLSTKLDRWWRVLATGYCFAFFGVYAIVLSATLFPWLRLTSHTAEEGRIRIQRSMSGVFAFFWRMMRTVGVITDEPCDADSLARLRKPGQLIVANHPTLIDVVLLVSLLPEVDCIVKDALWRNPFLRWPVLWAGYIPNRTAEELVEICAANLKAGRSLLVFPEGTRTVPGRPLSMRRGAAQIALASMADIMPVTISCEPLMLAKTQAWHEAPHGPGHFKVHIGEKVSARQYAPTNVPHSLAARAVTRWFQEYFTASLAALRDTAATDDTPPRTGREAQQHNESLDVRGATLVVSNAQPLSFSANDIHRHANP